MVIFHSYVSLPEGIWSYDHMIIDDMFGVWLRKNAAVAYDSREHGWVFFPCHAKNLLQIPLGRSYVA